MKAAYMLDKTIHVGTVDDPAPGDGQVLVKSIACGVCASDLHLLHHGERIAQWSQEYDAPFALDLSRPTVMGHEFVAEIIDYGPNTQRRLPKGTRVTSAPIAFDRAGKVSAIGLATDFPGGFGEYMVLTEALLQPVPQSLGTDLAAMAEPLSVGLHYVAAARLDKRDVPLVIGCGAIGLAVIMGLKLADSRPIIAVDFSPSRREFALRMGADIAVDPRELSPYAIPAQMGGKTPTVIFECVGTPRVLDGVLRAAAPRSRILVAGWCLEEDHLFTACAHAKGLNIQFGGGPGPEDFEQAVRSLGDGLIDASPWLGERVGLSGVGNALEAITNPDNPIRTLVDPRLP